MQFGLHENPKTAFSPAVMLESGATHFCNLGDNAHNVCQCWMTHEREGKERRVIMWKNSEFLANCLGSAMGKVEIVRKL